MDGFDYAVAAGLIAIGLVTLGLTSVGAITIVVLFAIAWFFGAHKRFAFAALIAGSLFTAWQLITGDLAGVIASLWHAYNENPWPSTVDVWLKAALRIDAWLALCPPSLVLSAIFLFLYLDWRDSQLRALTTSAGEARKALAPWVLLRIRLRMKKMAALQETTSLPSGALIGIDAATGDRIALATEQLNTHVVLVGRSGAGKTTALLNIIEFCIRVGIPVFLLDGKGERELANRILRFARKFNRPTYLIDANDPLGSCFYDPFAGKNYTQQADCIIALRNVWTEEHYELLASDHMQTVCKVLDRVGIKPTLIELPDFLSTSTLFGLIRRAKLDKAETKKLADEVAKLVANETKSVESLRSSIRALAGSSFSRIFDLREAERLNAPILNLAKARHEKAVVCIGIDALTLSKSGPRFAHLLINDLKIAVAGGEGLFLLAFDEFASYAGPQVTNLINMGRSHGACGVLASQSLADFRLPEKPQFLDQLIGSASTYIFHQLNVPSDAELAASIIGTSVGVEHTAQMVGEQLTGASSLRAVHEFEIHPQQIKSLKTGCAYVFSKTDGVICSSVKIRKSNI